MRRTGCCKDWVLLQNRFLCLAAQAITTNAGAHFDGLVFATHLPKDRPVLKQGEVKTAFIRRAVEAELKRRETRRKKR